MEINESNPLFTLTISEFKDLMRACISEYSIGTLTPLGDSESIIRTGIFLTRKEASIFLRISAVTLDRYRKFGIIPSKRIGNRVLFDPAEITKAMSLYNKTKTA